MPSEQDARETEQVHIAPTSSNRSAYHTRRCSHFPENPKAVTRERAEQQGLEPCTYCENRFEPANKGGRKQPEAPELEEQ